MQGITGVTLLKPTGITFASGPIFGGNGRLIVADTDANKLRTAADLSSS